MAYKKSRVFRYVAGLNGVNLFCPGLRCKDREDSRAAAYIHDNFTFEVNRVVKDSISVLASSYHVIQHVLLVHKFSVVRKILLHTLLIICVYATFQGLQCELG